MIKNSNLQTEQSYKTNNYRQILLTQNINVESHKTSF